jgi:hypothetical protein
MRIDRACEEFLRRVDAGLDGIERDPHVVSCTSCAIELGAAKMVRAALQTGSSACSARAPSAGAEAFAKRVAYLAWAERQDTRHRSPFGLRAVSHAIAGTMLALALGVSIRSSVPAVIEGLRGLPLDRLSLFVPAAGTLPILALLSCLAIVCARLTRRAA